VNTPAFLMAAFVHEKWLRILKGRRRGLEVLDPKPFEAKVEKLTASGGAGKQKAISRVAKPKSSAAAKPAKKAPMRKAPASKGRRAAAL